MMGRMGMMGWGGIVALALVGSVSGFGEPFEGFRAMNYVVVGPNGPDDGADFGPNTPGTKTSGIQEAFDAAKVNRKDVYIAGGTMPGTFQNGVVYHLQETLRIPWSQDFHLDGGEYVLNYDKTTGDAVVIDSQMSCRMKFGLIVAPTDGVVVHLKPETKGPDGFAVITASTFEFNAIVGGGSVFPDGKKEPAGTGLLLDAGSGPILFNKVYATEIIACRTGVLMHCGAEGNPASVVCDNAFEVPFLHLCATHLQVGDEKANVCRNRFTVNIGGGGVENPSGARIFGKENVFTMDIVETAPGRGLVFEKTSVDNLVTLHNGNGGVTNLADVPTNRVTLLSPAGFGVETPGVPASGALAVNRICMDVEALVLDGGVVSEWAIVDAHGVEQTLPGPLTVGQAIRLAPGEGMRFVYTTAPVWRWRAL